MNDREFHDSQSGCFGKDGFKTKHQAAEVAKKASRRRDARLNPYHCQFCGLFHIGLAKKRLHRSDMPTAN